MKAINAEFTIIDNTGAEYKNSIVIANPLTSNTMEELKNKIMSVYRLKNIDQIISIGNIQAT